MKGKIIENGTIVKIVIKDTIQYCKDGYRMGGNIGYENNELLIYEKIDLENFPSFNDFFGRTTIVKHGDHAVVLDYVGRSYKVGNNLTLSSETFAHLDAGNLNKVGLPDFVKPSCKNRSLFPTSTTKANVQCLSVDPSIVKVEPYATTMSPTLNFKNPPD